jgi:hypothetical protein
MNPGDYARTKRGSIVYIKALEEDKALVQEITELKEAHFPVSKLSVIHWDSISVSLNEGLQIANHILRERIQK